jgi:hypothetical protein
MNAPRPRVLLVVNSLGYGGTERMIERLVLALEARGEVRYTVASLEGPGPIGARLKAAGVDVRAFHLPGGALADPRRPPRAPAPAAIREVRPGPQLPVSFALRLPSGAPGRAVGAAADLLRALPR